MGEGEVPEEVAAAVNKEFSQKPESERKTWNARFNSIADKLGEDIKKSKDDLNPLLRNAPTTAKEIPGHITRQAGAATVLIGMTELSALKLLAEIGAKATGGRKPSTTAHPVQATK